PGRRGATRHLAAAGRRTRRDGGLDPDPATEHATGILRPHGDRGPVTVPARARLCPRRRRRAAYRSVPGRTRATGRPRQAGRACRGADACGAGHPAVDTLSAVGHAGSHPGPVSGNCRPAAAPTQRSMNPVAAVQRGELAALLVVLGVLVLLPIGRSSELPVLLAALAGIGLLANRARWQGLEPVVRPVVALFACYWLPILLSAFAAVEPQKTWTTALETLRFLPFAVFAGWALRRPRSWPVVQMAIAVIAGLWLIDAWVQALGGGSLAGGPEAERLSGIFGADNLKLGPVLSVLSPFVLLVARERGGRPGLLL